MKKILLLIFVFIILVNPILAAEIKHKFYYSSAINGYFDLATFEADTNNNYKTDILYDISGGGDGFISSPYDKNDIYYIIVRIINIAGQPYLTYKGFVTGEYIPECSYSYKFGNVKFYYDNNKNNILDLNVYLDNIKDVFFSSSYKDEIKYIIKAYHNKTLGTIGKETL